MALINDLRAILSKIQSFRLINRKCYINKISMLDFDLMINLLKSMVYGKYIYLKKKIFILDSMF